MLHYLEDWGPALAELRRVLKPGGRLIVSVEHPFAIALMHCDLTAVLDWDAAGTGSPGIDLGSVRLDAALCYGQDAAAEILAGWEEEAGRPAPDVPYWDAVASLATPPDMALVTPVIADQGRPDLTRDLLTERRETFLRAALAGLDPR